MPFFNETKLFPYKRKSTAFPCKQTESGRYLNDNRQAAFRLGGSLSCRMETVWFHCAEKCRLKGSDGIGASGRDLVRAFEHFVQFGDEQEQQEARGCADVEQQPVEADFVARLIAFFKQYAAQSEA